MSPPTSGSTIFAAIPYVRTVAPLALGPWKLWPNSEEHWLRETGVNLTWHMKMYRDRQNRAVDLAGSVLTRTDAIAPELEDVRLAVVAFSTVAWLGGHPSADPWVFDHWTIQQGASKGTWFVRSGKFSKNLTNPSVERIFPTPYLSPITLGPYVPPQISHFLETELKVGGESAVLRALSQMHEVRFETPYQTSPGNDLEALWTAYEALFLSRRPSAAPPATTLFTRLRELFFARKRRHLRRNERLTDAVRAQLRTTVGVDERAFEGIAVLVDKLWAARNAHSHGGEVQPSARVDDLETGVWSAGLQLFEALLRIRIAQNAGDEVFFLPSAVDQLNEIFLRIPTFKKVVATLAALDARTWYASAQANRSELEQLDKELVEFVSFRRVDGWVAQRDVAKARGFVRRILTAWVKDLIRVGAHGEDVDSIASLPERDAAVLNSLKQRGLTGAALDDALDEELAPFVRDSDVYRAVELGWSTGAPPLGGVIALSRWARVYIRLHELYIGYELV